MKEVFLSSEKIDSIIGFDLSQIESAAASKNGWDISFTERVSSNYKKFTLLCLSYPNMILIPTMEINSFWVEHIQQDVEYQKFCRILGNGYFHYSLTTMNFLNKESIDAFESLLRTTAVLWANEFKLYSPYSESEMKELVKEKKILF